MIVSAPVFMAQHIGLIYLIAMAYPKQYHPGLFAFGALQGIMEHYADTFPVIAGLGPILVPIAIVLLSIHYYFANKVIADKRIVWGGFIGYFIILVLSKSLELGFPKDTAEEQIEALGDCTYSMNHFGLHVALIACLAVTASNLPKEVAPVDSKKAA